ncbi:alpha/beta hydrolase [Streptomyces sp. MZ04]|uniref:alpha/beta hydrolase n=1 Tax=Streptomyces sp. MZ04 TaxID=2559236 RepID=UPI00107E7C8D|nr:alpha/beta hydrolase [Streptomyces sp. MZ04]TGB15638.1 alpha/beta hydrolase [Streptomyces sp. MZ04]
MTTRLVFVHGVGGPRDTAAELGEWLRALTDGARAAGHSRRAPHLLHGGAVDVRFAYYGDLFTDDQAQGTTTSYDDASHAASLVALMLEAVDEHMAEAEDAYEARVLLRARTQLAPEGDQQGAGDVLRQALNAANTLLAMPGLRKLGGWASDRLMVHQLGQVRRYLTRAAPDRAGLGLDQRIRERVTRELDPSGPTVVVAHSLGTVVAFEALHDHAGSVPLLVTLGSPIGMRTAVRSRMRPQPLSVPAAVGGWLNFWDRDDFIVGRPQLEKCVDRNAAAVLPVSRRVDSDGLWVHPAAKYLAAPGVAGPVIEALEAAATT